MPDLSEQAYRFIKRNKKQIINRFIPQDIQTNNRPVFIFMAGAPGAGKTEFSKRLIEILEKHALTGGHGIVRIDADEIRELFIDIGYNGKNSDVFKRGCIKGVETLYDYCLKKGYNTILDGTLSFLNIAKRNIHAALQVDALVFIVYVYQDPLVAWGFSKIREKEEGRRIEKIFFIESLFKSINSVNELKKEYNNDIEVWLVEKDIFNDDKTIKFNINNIDNYLELSYTREDLRNKLYE